MANTITVNVIGDVSKLKNSLTQANSQMTGMQKASSRAGSFIGKSFKVMGAAALAGGVAMAGGLKYAIDEARESEKVTARTANVIKSMGNVAGISAKGVADLSTSLSNKTAIDDEVIQSGANLLLTFGNIRNEAGKGNDIFNQTVGLANDMSVALGQDMKSSSIQLGKALNDPIKGVTALSRVGVSFTEQQKEQIKTLVESGNVLGAQKVILGEVQKQFGGAGEAAANPMEKLRVIVGNLAETIGTALLPYIDKFATYLGENMPAYIEKARQMFESLKPTLISMRDTFVALLPTLQNIGQFFVNHAGTILKVAAAFYAITAAVAAYNYVLRAYSVISKVITALTVVWRNAQLALNLAMMINPIGLVVLAVVALVAIFVVAWKKSETFRNIIIGTWNAIKKAASAVWGFIKNLLSNVWDWIKSYGKAVFESFKNVVTTVWNAIKTATSAVWNAIKTAVTLYFKLIKTAITLYFNAYKTVITTAWKVIKTVTTTVWNAIKSAVSAVYNFLKTGIQNAFNFYKTIITNVWNAVKNGTVNAWNGIKSAVQECGEQGCRIRKRHQGPYRFIL